MEKKKLLKLPLELSVKMEADLSVIRSSASEPTRPKKKKKKAMQAQRVNPAKLQQSSNAKMFVKIACETVLQVSRDTDHFKVRLAATPCTEDEHKFDIIWAMHKIMARVGGISLG